MINLFSSLINQNKKINPLIKELIDFTRSQNPESFKIMDLLPELNKLKPTDADLNALEKALKNKENWHSNNCEYWEKIIINILIENGRMIQK